MIDRLGGCCFRGRDSYSSDVLELRNHDVYQFLGFCLCVLEFLNIVFFINASTSKLLICSLPYWYVPYRRVMGHVWLWPVIAITLGWNAPSIILYYFVSNAVLVSGDVGLGKRWYMKYRNAWWWLNGLNVMMVDSVFVLCRITLNWYYWLPSGDDVTPRYLHFSIRSRCWIVHLMLSLNGLMSILLFELCLFIYGISLSINSHVIRYHPHFASSRPPPNVWSICSQVLATVWIFLHIYFLIIFSLAYCRLLSTNPMICFVRGREESGDVMSKLWQFVSIVSIMEILWNNHILFQRI